MNTELLLEVADAIEDEANGFDQLLYFDCQTPKCVAGWIIELGLRKPFVIADGALGTLVAGADGVYRHAEDYARRIAGLKFKHMSLFNSHPFAADVNSRRWTGDEPSELVYRVPNRKEASAAIRNLVRTGEVCWQVIDE